MRRFSRSSRYSVIPSPTWQMICRLACPAALPESFLSLPPCLILQHPLALIFDKCRIRAVALAFLLCNKHLRNTRTAILFGMPAVADGNLIELNPANDYSCRRCGDGRWEPLTSRKARYTDARKEESRSASRARRSNQVKAPQCELRKKNKNPESEEFGELSRRLGGCLLHETEHGLLQLRIHFVRDGHHVEHNGAEIHAA